MNRTKYCLSLLLLIFFPGLLSAQSHFQPGFIVQDDSTVTKGWIDAREWDRNPEKFSFTAREKGKATTYALDKVRYFEINGIAAFQWAIVSISLDKRTLIQGFSTGPDKRTRQDTVFLKVVATGTVLNLYAYTDDIKTRYYMRDNSTGVYTELIYQRYYTDHEPPRIATNTLYRNQLQFMAARAKNPKSSRLLSRLSGADYTDASLASVVAMINGQQEKKETYKLNFYAGLSLYRSKGIYGNGYIFTEGADIKTSYLPKISIGADLFNNGYTKRFIYRLDLSLSAADQGLSRLETSGRTTSHSYKQYTATFTPQVIANVYNGQKLQANIGTGFGINLSIYDNKPVIIANTQFDREEKMNLRSFWLSVPIRAGIIINKRFDIYGQYLFGSTLHGSNSFFSLRADAWQAGVNILFW